AMIQAPHGVERVGGMAGAALDGGKGLIEAGVGMPQAAMDSQLSRMSNGLDRPGKLRRDGDHPQRAPGGLPEAVQQLWRGLDKVFRGMDAPLGVADEGPFQMNTQRPRADVTVVICGNRFPQMV